MKRKPAKKRRTNPRVLVLVEGETERNYFLAIKQDPDYKKKLAALTVEVKKTKKQASKEMVEQALKMIKGAEREDNAYDSVWLVFDHDNNPKREEAWETVEQAGRKINMAFSAIAFEQWYLLHFKKSGKVFQSAGELIKDLKKYFPEYEKAKQNDFAILKEKLDVAFENTTWLRDQKNDNNIPITDRNPWTDVDTLVDYLLTLNKS